MSPIDIYGVALAVIQILEKLGVVYELGGSLASSLHGTPRSTLDADIVADLRPSQVPGFIEALGSDYYAVPDAIRESILRRRSFNIIHTATALKIDIFPIKDNPFSITEFSRRRQASFPPPSGPQVWVCSPEDIILHKLRWYLDGGCVVDRQLQDAIGVLRVLGMTLDLGYLQHWAGYLKVNELLTKATLAAGLTLPEN